MSHPKYDTCLDIASSVQCVEFYDVQSQYTQGNADDMASRGNRPPAYDQADTVGIDIMSDMHSDGFDRFEHIRDTTRANLDAKRQKAYLEKIAKGEPTPAADGNANEGVE